MSQYTILYPEIKIKFQNYKEYIKKKNIMRILVKTLANLAGMNPDQMSAYAVENAEEYDTTGGGVDNVEVSEDFAYDLIQDFQFDNRKGHDWRAKTVQESLNEINFERTGDAKSSIGIGIAEKWREELKDLYGGREANEYIKSLWDQRTHRKALLNLLKDMYGKGEIEYIPNLLTDLNFYTEMKKEAPEFLEKVTARDPDVFLQALGGNAYRQEERVQNLKKYGMEEEPYNIAFKHLPPQKVWKLLVNNKDEVGMKKASERGVDITKGRIQPYLVAIEKRDLELLKILIKDGIDPTTGFPRPGRKEYNYPIRRSAFEGWLEGFTELLKDPRTDPSDHKNSAVKNVVKEIENLENKVSSGRHYAAHFDDCEGNSDDIKRDYEKILELLLKDPRVQEKLDVLPISTKAALGMNESMKLVQESLNEVNFERGQDPKRSMGIGKKTQIEAELEKIGIDPDSVEITDNLILKSKGSYRSEELQKIAIKYLRPDWKKFVKELRKGDPKKAVENALEEEIPNEIIEELINEFGDRDEDYRKTDHRSLALIHYKKLTRGEEKVAEDEEYNDYVFIAFQDKVPVTVNGEKYYKDGWGTEGMIKIDRYDTSSLSSVSGLKLRVRFAGDGSNVYMISVPSDFMDEERYNEFPDIIQQNFDEYLERGIIRRI